MNNNNNQKKQQPIENNNNNNETSNKSNNNSYGGPLFVICIAFIKLLVTVVVKYAQDGENLLDTVFGFILVFLKNIFMKNNNNHHHNHYQKYKEVWKQGFLFATSSLLYTLYDNLTFINLLHINPGIYSIFMQSRILMTAFLHKLVFQSSIPMQKWFALSLLTFGVVLKYIFNLQESENSKNENVTWWVIFFILLQSFLSVCAGLYNEYLFKKNMNISIHLQNFFMYLFAILFNFFIYVVKNHNNHNKNNNEMIKNAENNNNNNNWGNYTIVVMSGAVMGLSAAFILKFIDIIVKSIASAVEIIIISFLSHVLFGEKFSFLDFVSACMVGPRSISTR
ncbi:nucleotide sugar transporter [Angomonas deanei]|uniref:Nucleotide-sugar transporter, putative n=1 Tax=Angomonas deanei TaxID=59799 RepID=A0A7G2CPW3_9TRYP|nr:nucleotide sugar transporter [Angomonas deanei]CAD2221868.1 Nucleotide-sugar transporter, putative [Angomonas deanei]|eukprot:EPY35768.1 nucleotide sugar transporter [Angomonas deanei]